jgi:hypothetical protein
MGKVNARGAEELFRRLGVEFTAESHSCCNEATFQTLFIG